MQIIKETMQFHIEGKTAVAIGKFDGIHKGHQKLVEEIIKAKEEGLLATIFTFDPPPSVLFSGEKLSEIMTKEEKRQQFEKMGVDILIEFPLTKESAAILPEDFIRDILVEKLHVKKVVAGRDVSFGDKGKGDCKLLQELAETYSYQVEIVDKVCLENKEISSTYVREEIAKGNMTLVEKLLGRPYQISGVVEKGNQIGRTIEIPTVNIKPFVSKALPPDGVYFSKVQIVGEEKTYRGLTNIGYKPTVSEEKRKGVETYLYDFEGDLYGKEIEVSLLAYERAEKKFENLEALKKQIQKDKEAGLQFFLK